MNRELWLNNSQLNPDKDYYSTNAFNNYAVEFVADQKKSDKPFFLYLAHIAPHFPLQALPEDISKYRGKYKLGFETIRKERLKKQVQLNLIDKDLVPSPIEESSLDWDRLTSSKKDSIDLKMAVYAAQITCMDRGIGNIINKLKETNQFDNTLILFLSDNGGTAERAYKIKGANGEIGTSNSWESYGLNWANVSNTPYRKYKTFMQEGGIITPLIASFPNVIKENRIDKSSIGSIRDIMPTVLDLAGIEYPKTFNGKNLRQIDGESLMPIFKNTINATERTLFFEHAGNRGAREGDWKLVSIYPADKWELYNLKTDPTEINNLSLKYPKKVEHLDKLYNEWAQNSGVLPWRTIIARNKKLNCNCSISGNHIPLFYYLIIFYHIHKTM